MRIGLITSNFGRIVSFLSAILYLKSLPTNEMTPRQKLVLKSYWLFPYEEDYPYISTHFRRHIKVVSPRLMHLYRLLSKMQRLGSLFVISQDHLNEYQLAAWSNAFSFKTGIEKIPNALRQEFDRLEINLANIVLVHTRDSDWDISGNQSCSYVQGEAYRNSNLTEFKLLVEFLLSNGYSVIRTGRSRTKLFKEDRSHFFDYASSDLVSDRNDFFIWENCLSAICSLNGGCNIGLLFKKPLLIWDYAEPLDTIINATVYYPSNRLFVVQRRTLEGIDNDAKLKLLEEFLILSQRQGAQIDVGGFFRQSLNQLRYE